MIKRFCNGVATNLINLLGLSWKTRVRFGDFELLTRMRNDHRILTVSYFRMMLKECLEHVQGLYWVVGCLCDPYMFFNGLLIKQFGKQSNPLIDVFKDNREQGMNT